MGLFYDIYSLVHDFFHAGWYPDDFQTMDFIVHYVAHIITLFVMALPFVVFWKIFKLFVQ